MSRDASLGVSGCEFDGQRAARLFLGASGCEFDGPAW